MTPVAVVHQELQLVPELTVGENLTLGRFPNRGGIIAFGAATLRVPRALAEVGGRRHRHRAARSSTLSIGQRQMVEIAKAIMFDARVIALDEPTSSLSSRESEVLFALVDRLRAQGKVILYVSHRLDEVFRLCDGARCCATARVAAHPLPWGVTRDHIVRQWSVAKSPTSGVGAAANRRESRLQGRRPDRPQSCRRPRAFRCACRRDPRLLRAGRRRTQRSCSASSMAPIRRIGGR